MMSLTNSHVLAIAALAMLVVNGAGARTGANSSAAPRNETIRTESGALYYMLGPIQMESKAPSVGGIFKALTTGESIFRPTYSGSGELFLEPTFGGYHIFEVAGKTWIL